jgi:hypothetical protein
MFRRARDNRRSADLLRSAHVGQRTVAQFARSACRPTLCCAWHPRVRPGGSLIRLGTGPCLLLHRLRRIHHGSPASAATLGTTASGAPSRGADSASCSVATPALAFCFGGGRQRGGVGVSTSKEQHARITSQTLAGTSPRRPHPAHPTPRTPPAPTHPSAAVSPASPPPAPWQCRCPGGPPPRRCGRGRAPGWLPERGRARGRPCRR